MVPKLSPKQGLFNTLFTVFWCGQHRFNPARAGPR